MALYVLSGLGETEEEFNAVSAATNADVAAANAAALTSAGVSPEAVKQATGVETGHGHAETLSTGSSLPSAESFLGGKKGSSPSFDWSKMMDMLGRRNAPSVNPWATSHSSSMVPVVLGVGVVLLAGLAILAVRSK